MDVRTEEPRGPGSFPTEVLVEPTWLRERLGDALVRPVDLRDAEAYAAGHVPGATRLDLRELGTTVGACDNVLLAPRVFEGLMERLGVSNDHMVVAYDDQWGLAAARLLWALHRHGHTRVAVLNGGWDRWRDEGGASATGATAVQAVRFVSDLQEAVHADLARVEAVVDSRTAVLLDTRTSAEFDRGHVPGAISWDWLNAVPVGSVDATRDPDELRAEWDALGIAQTDEVVVYCRSGMRAAHTYLVLRHAGFPRVRLYDGSWQEWAMIKGGGDGH